jgi:molybdopterin-synthase adenylyltransferase
MSMFNIEELVRYGRQIMLADIGIEGQQKLKQAKVLVVGAGGLGCPLLQYLCAAGTGTIGLVDFDVIEVHNLHRQILYNTEDIGKPKAITAAEKLKALNPNVTIIPFNELLSEENAERIIAEFDIVADGSDNFNTRYLVNDTCVKLKKPLVYGSILRSEGQLAVFNLNGSKHLRDLFHEPPAPEDVPSCSETGVLGIVPGIIGSMMCDMVMKVILGKAVDVNTLFIFDLEQYALRKLKY